MKRGFTYIELLLVIIILGILTSISAPSFKNSFNDLKLNNSAKRIAILIKQLQAHAFSRTEIFCLEVRSQEGVLQPLSKVNFRWQPLKTRDIKTVILPQGINLLLSPKDKMRIYFYPDGSIDKTDVILESGKNRKIILTLEDITGNVKISGIEQ